MSTWGEIREQALTFLDVRPDASTDDDIRNAVDRRMIHVRDKLHNIRCPESLFLTSSAVTIDADNEHVKIVDSAAANQPSFLLTDFRKIHSLFVEGEKWKFIPYSSWLDQQSSIAGDQRWAKSFTVYQGEQIILKTLPVGDDEWSLVLNYMKEPPAIVDGDEPDIHLDHHELIVLDIVLGFPNRFMSEERLALFSAFARQRDDLFKLYKQDSLVMKKDQRMKPFVRMQSSRITMWGDGDL